MKKIAILFTLYSICQMANAQTSDDDFNFITKTFLENQTSKDYSFDEIGSWGLTEGSTKRTITFVEMKKGGLKRGIIMVYKEVSNNTSTQKVFCIPGDGSTSDIWNKSFKLISNQNDEKLLKTCIWALMNYSQTN
jgi:hypothetical protein